MATLSARALTLKAGITYRQLDHWTVNGVIPELPGRFPGQGYPRRFDEAIVPKVKTIAVIQESFNNTLGTDVLKRIYENHDVGFIILCEDPMITLTWDV